MQQGRSYSQWPGGCAVLNLRDELAGFPAFILKPFSRHFFAGGQASDPRQSRESRLLVQ